MRLLDDKKYLKKKKKSGNLFLSVVGGLIPLL